MGSIVHIGIQVLMGVAHSAWGKSTRTTHHETLEHGCASASQWLGGVSFDEGGKSRCTSMDPKLWMNWLLAHLRLHELDDFRHGWMSSAQLPSLRRLSVII